MAQIFYQGKIKITEEGMNVRHNDIRLEQRPQEHYIMTEYSGGWDDADIYSAYAKHVSHCHENQIYSPYVTGGLIAVDGGYTSDDYCYSHLYTKLDPDDNEHSADTTVIEPCTYAVIYSTLGFEPVSSMLPALLDFARENDYIPGTHFFEDILIDNASTSSWDDYIIKIALPIKKRIL